MCFPSPLLLLGHPQAPTSTPAPPSTSPFSSSHSPFQVLIQFVEKLLGREPGLFRADQDRQVLGHEALLDGFNADALQRLGEALDLRSTVELAPIPEPARPREDRGDRIGRSCLALLVFAVMARH